MKPVVAFDNFPSFGNAGARTAPGEAKYAAGFVPADTFPAEWANYFFHGATKGISDLNSATRSIWLELQNVLTNYNITPSADPTQSSQILEALNKLKADAALAAHPVGSLYWTSVNENPATTFGGGTWTQIKDKFILAAGDTYTNGATGGAATVTLTTQQMPNHTHSVTCSGTVGSKTAGGSISGGAYKFSGSQVDTGGMSGNASHSHTLLAIVSGESKGQDVGAGSPTAQQSGTKHCLSITDSKWNYQFTTSNSVSVAHSHKVTASGTISVTTNPTFTGIPHDHTFTGSTVTSAATGGPNGATAGQASAHENMPPYIVKYCWERVS